MPWPALHMHMHMHTIYISSLRLREHGPGCSEIRRSHCASEAHSMRCVPLVRAAFFFIARPAPKCGRLGSFFRAFSSLGGSLGVRFSCISGCFRGRAGVLTKNVRHAFRLRHGEWIACRGLREGPENRPKIAPGASRERRSENIAQKRRLESARTPFLTDLARFGLVFGSSWVSFASFFGSRASPGVLRACPGSPRITPEAPRTLPERSGFDFGSVLPRCSLVFGRFFWLVLAAFVRLSFVFAAFVRALVPWCVPSFVYARTCAP